MLLLDIYELRDLRLFTGRDLRALLLEESRTWQRRLRWDYRESIELLIGYLDNHILPGFVALHRMSGHLHGYTFAVYEAQKSVLGDLYATDSLGGTEKLALETLLLRHQLPMLQHTPGVERVESQLLLADGGLQSTFAEAGFRSFPRLFMEAELLPVPEVVPPALLGTLRLKRWTAPMYQPAAELIHRAYIGHGDTIVNDQYATVQGCLRFLHNIVRFPGCGTFSPEHSWVLTDERTGELEGLALATRVEADTAHIPQLCVATRQRGRGLGRFLLRHSMAELARAGMRGITLTVTEANVSALRLYQSLGFCTRHAFQANVWTR